MSASKTHTPGPWKATGFDVCDASGRAVATVFDPSWIPDSGLSGEDEDIITANADLIAAAPELLKAAKRALAVFKAQGESIRPGSVLGALVDAINKANPPVA